MMDVRNIEDVAPVVEHNGTVPVWWMVNSREMKDLTDGGFLELVNEFEVAGGGYVDLLDVFVARINPFFGAELVRNCIAPGRKKKPMESRLGEVFVEAALLLTDVASRGVRWSKRFCFFGEEF